MLSCAHVAPTQPSRPACTCNHRAAARADTKQREDPEHNKIKIAPRERAVTPRDKQPRDQLDSHNLITPVLAVAIRRNPQDKDPIVQFNGVAGQETRLSFTPFVKHVSTQTSKSNVHVEFEIPDESWRVNASRATLTDWQLCEQVKLRVRYHDKIEIDSPCWLAIKSITRHCVIRLIHIKHYGNWKKRIDKNKNVLCGLYFLVREWIYC